MSTPTDSNDKVLLQPYNYILQITGKQLRTKLIEAFNYWLQIPADTLKVVSDIVEMLHNASLLIDDIEDNSILRRGIPVAHEVFGIGSTINCANYVYFLSLEKMIRHLPQTKVSEAVTIFTEQLLELHRGQGMDIYWRDSFTCPSEEEYLQMIRKKTGGLFGLGVRLLRLFTDDTRDYSNLIAILGTYFQIRDDYSNLKSSEYEANKSYCEDLTEGKFSFPIVNAITTRPNDPTILSILRQRPTKREIKKFVVDKLEEFGAFQYTLNTLHDLEAKVRAEICKLGDNPFLSQIMDYLSNTICT